MTIVEKYKGKMIKKVSNTGIPKEEYNALTNQVAELNNQVNNLTNDLTNKVNESENTRSALASLMQEGGYDITGDEDINSLLELLELSGISVSEIKQIVSGMYHTIVLKANGSLWACGHNGYGQLGLNDTTNRASFTQVTENINNDVKQVACGFYHTVILKKDGSLWSCGNNGYGQLGLGDTTERYTFTQITTNINNNVKQVACGLQYTVILKNDGSLWSCGRNSYGELGLNNTSSKTTFTKATTNVYNDVKQIICGSYYTFILKTDGSVWACGQNTEGQLGLGNTTNKFIFAKVATNINNDVKQIACGDSHTIILKNDGSVWSCGNNDKGQLGLGDTSDRKTFTQVTTNINNDVKKVICGYNYTIILKTDGSVWSCGQNNSGQLGLGTSDTNAHSTFTQATTNISDVKQIACGGYHTIILKTDDSVWFCGLNNNGQLGLNDTDNRTTFTQVPRGL